MKQRGIGDRFSLGLRDGTIPRYVRPRTEKLSWSALCRSLRGRRLELCDQLVQAELLQTLADSIQLTRRELDQALALGAEPQGLAQAGLVRSQPGDDLLEPLDGGLVGGCLGRGHR